MDSSYIVRGCQHRAYWPLNSWLQFATALPFSSSPCPNPVPTPPHFRSFPFPTSRRLPCRQWLVAEIILILLMMIGESWFRSLMGQRHLASFRTQPSCVGSGTSDTRKGKGKKSSHGRVTVDVRILEIIPHPDQEDAYLIHRPPEIAHDFKADAL